MLTEVRGAEEKMATPLRILLIGLVLVLSGLGCQPSSDSSDPVEEGKTDSDKHLNPSTPTQVNQADIHNEEPKSAEELVMAPAFEDQAEQRGIEFVYDTGAFGQRLMTEATGGGVGWLDYNLDGALDLFFVQGGNPQQEIPHPEGDQLYRQVEGGQFQKITQHFLNPDQAHSQCVSVGDYDNDGYLDLFVSNVGRNQLLHNLGDGTFEDVTESSGLGETDLWSTTAVWVDLDLDGDLDLYVCNYTNYDARNPVICRHPDGSPASCDPLVLDAVDNECYENLGDGRFRSVAEEWGLIAPDGKSLGVVAADFDRDGNLDLYVANDVTPNHLFQADAAGHYQEQAVLLGAAASELGQYQASMGIAVGDYDRNGFLDLYVT
ncbi:MAG: VCBS repeat-containing protein, partial [Planctomycetaceae bacterium]|nr:VCBS repeat-containing protein [Planctomycetaceae bacterium]